MERQTLREPKVDYSWQLPSRPNRNRYFVVIWGVPHIACLIIENPLCPPAPIRPDLHIPHICLPDPPLGPLNLTVSILPYLSTRCHSALPTFSCIVREGRLPVSCRDLVIREISRAAPLENSPGGEFSGPVRPKSSRLSEPTPASVRFGGRGANLARSDRPSLNAVAPAPSTMPPVSAVATAV